MKRTIDDQINEIIINFDFKKVYNVMRFLDWTWYGYKSSPTVDMLKEAAKKRLRNVYQLTLDSNYKESHYVSSGGLRGVCTKYLKNDEDIFVFELHFDCVNWDSNPFDNMEKE